jgi:hypothetical protein
MDLTTEQLAQKDTWERLDGALSKAAFQALEVIAFRLLDVHGCIYPKGDIEDAVTRIRNWLPGCETHRVIQFYSF